MIARYLKDIIIDKYGPLSNFVPRVQNADNERFVVIQRLTV